MRHKKRKGPPGGDRRTPEKVSAWRLKVQKNNPPHPQNQDTWRSFGDVINKVISTTARAMEGRSA